MASIRQRPRKDGTLTYSVLYVLDGVQTSVPFTTEREAEKFRALITAAGAARAMEVMGIGRTKATSTEMLLSEWLDYHIKHLSGCEKRTVWTYERFVSKDINPVLGAIPITKLTRADVQAWVVGMTGSAKTIKNKHVFLASALKRAVAELRIPFNPCSGIRLPRSEKAEMAFLSLAEYRSVHDAIAPEHKVFLEFLVSSGCRWSEATALKPSDVNRSSCTVRISRAWKQLPSGAGFEIGPPKTPRSVRTINVPKEVLDQLDYSGSYLFGGEEPLRVEHWRHNVWRPAVKHLDKHVRIHDLRHTCVSWMIAANVHLPLIQAHLGHESVTTTIDLYGHLDRETAQAASNAIAAMLLRTDD